MKNKVIRQDAPVFPEGTYYVRSVSKDGAFALTLRKASARRFTEATAREHMARFKDSGMQFSLCDAPQEVAP